MKAESVLVGKSLFDEAVSVGMSAPAASLLAVQASLECEMVGKSEEFDESKHPRDKGRFSSKGDGKEKAKIRTPKEEGLGKYIPAHGEQEDADNRKTDAGNRMKESLKKLNAHRATFDSINKRSPKQVNAYYEEHQRLLAEHEKNKKDHREAGKYY